MENPTDLLLDPSNSSDAAPKSGLARHGNRFRNSQPSQQRHKGADICDAGRRPIFLHSTTREMQMNVDRVRMLERIIRWRTGDSQRICVGFHPAQGNLAALPDHLSKQNMSARVGLFELRNGLTSPRDPVSRSLPVPLLITLSTGKTPPSPWPLTTNP